MKRPSFLPLFLFLWLADAVSLRAHDAWLQPARFTSTPGTALTLDLSRAPRFDASETATSPWLVARAFGRLGGEAFLLTDAAVHENTLRFTPSFARPGVAVLCAELKPQRRELAPAQIEPLFRALHANAKSPLRAAWAKVPAPARWRELRVTHAKTFVRVGEPPSADRAWAEPLGLALELIPERDPTSLRVGQDFAVRLLRSGVPLAGVSLSFVATGETREHVVFTDAQGRARAKLDAPGPWLVHATDLRRSLDPELEWEVDLATLVVTTGS